MKKTLILYTNLKWKTFIFLLWTLSLPSQRTLAQDFLTDQIVCGSSELHNQSLLSNPSYQGQVDKMEVKVASYTRDNNSSAHSRSMYTLPIVIHVVHNNGPENINESQALQAVEYLNQAFRNEGDYDPSTGVNIDVQFCLATRKSDGGPTTGINWIKSEFTSITIESEDAQLKNLMRWDPLSYMNIWVVKDIKSLSLGSDVSGYATLPFSHGRLTDGIVIEADYFGTDPASTSVLIHEMGHYLGLYHTFEGGCKNDDCLVDGDRVCDTPPDQSTARIPCNENMNSCDTDTKSGFTTDRPDMIHNYIDYSYLACQSAFTPGQAARMKYFIKSTRSSLLESMGCQNPCLLPISVSISPTDKTINIGDQVNFTTVSSGANKWTWYLEGLFADNGADWSHVFNQQGTFLVRVEAENADPNCMATAFITITVICPVEARFDQGLTTINAGDNRTFMNTSSNATTYEWILNDNSVSFDENFNYTFLTTGSYRLKLIAGNGLCRDTTGTFIFNVIDPCVEQEKTFHVQLPSTTSGWIYKTLKMNNGHLVVSMKGVIVCIDQDFTIIWSFTLNSNWSGRNINIFNAVEDLSDGGIICMAVGLIEKRSYILKLSNTGQLLWSKRIFDLDYDNTASLIRLSDGNFAACVAYNIPNQNASTTSLLKIDSYGNVLWDSGIQNMSNPSIAETVNGDIMLISSNDDLLPPKNAANIMKFDRDGNKIWYKDYWTVEPSTPHVIAGSPVPNLAGGIVTIANLKSNTTGGSFASILSVDGNGDILWHRRFNDNTGLYSNLYFHHIIRSTNNDMIVFGVAKSTPYNRIVLKIKDNGEVLWARNYGIDASNWFGPFGRASSLNNGGFVVGYRSGTGDNHHLIQADENGMMGACPVQEVDFESVLINSSNVLNSRAEYSFPVIEDFTLYRVDRSAQIMAQNCVNNEAKNPDLFVQVFEGNKCGDSIYIDFEICNLGNSSISPLIPIAVYGDDPTTTNARTYSFMSYNNSLANGECDTVQFAFIDNLDSEVENVYLVAGDDGSSLLPFNVFTDFPIIALNECIYFNNLDSGSLFRPEINTVELNLGLDTFLCTGAEIVLGTNDFYTTYRWSTGDTDTSIVINQPGTYSLTVSNACHDEMVDELIVTSYVAPTLDLGADITVCHDMASTIKATVGFDEYIWQDGAIGSVYTSWSPGKYWVEAVDRCGNSQYDTIRIAWATDQNLFPANTKLCLGDSVSLSLSGFKEYLWSPASLFSCVTCPDVVIYPENNEIIHFIGTDQNGCLFVDTMSIIVDSLDYQLEINNVACGDIDGSISISSNQPNLQYAIDNQPFQTSGLFEQIGIGNHVLEVMNGSSCTDSTHFSIVENNPPQVFLPNDTILKPGQSILIDPSVLNADSIRYIWKSNAELNCYDCEMVIFTPTENSYLILEILNEFGCISLDTMNIEVDFSANIFIPNIFSPNKDRTNDYLKVFTNKTDLHLDYFMVFNRWGDRVFEQWNVDFSKELNLWDGYFLNKPCETGVYAYVLKMKNGEEIIALQGNVTLIR